MTTLTIDTLLKAMELAVPPDTQPVGAIVSPLIWDALRREHQSSAQEAFNYFSGLPLRPLHELLPNEWACYNSKGDLLHYSGRENFLRTLAKVVVRYT